MNARTSAVYEIRRVDGEFCVVHKCGALGFEQIVERFDRRPDAEAMVERLNAAAAPSAQAGRASPAFLFGVAFIVGVFLFLSIPSCHAAGLPPQHKPVVILAPTAPPIRQPRIPPQMFRGFPAPTSAPIASTYPPRRPPSDVCRNRFGGRCPQ